MSPDLLSQHLFYASVLRMLIDSIKQEVKKQSRAGRWLDLLGWVVFCGWIFASAFVSSLPQGSGPLGLGTLVFAVALLRKLLGFSISYFWLTIGGVFLLAGIGDMSSLDLPYSSIALIVCGILLLLHNRSGKHHKF